MSVSIKTDGTSSFGKMEITSNSDGLSGEDVARRVQTIINVIQAVNFDMMSNEDLYFMMEILQDHLPTVEQSIEIYKPQMVVVKK